MGSLALQKLGHRGGIPEIWVLISQSPIWTNYFGLNFKGAKSLMKSLEMNSSCWCSAVFEIRIFRLDTEKC